jgi:aryl-alcohol dehydrogenase-like predicted oxidoreductase
MSSSREFTKLNRNVSEIGLGCWQLGGDFGAIEDATAVAVVEKAIVEGIDFFDTADVYGGGRSEKLLGEVLNRHGRDRFTIASKVGRGGGLFPDRYSRDAVKAGVEASLQRLGIDCLDLIQLHCVPLKVLGEGEIFNWLRELVSEGKVRAFGASVETVEQGMAALTQPDLASLQIIFNLFRQKPREELFGKAKDQGTALIVRLPLNSGLLAGKMTKETSFEEGDHRNYNRDGAAFSVGETFGGLPFDTGVDLVERLRPYCPHDYSMADFAQRFILDFPEVTTVITGASGPEQVARNAAVSSLDPLHPETHEHVRKFYYEQVAPYIRGEQ